jgi:predicted nucleotidyltransferase
MHKLLIENKASIEALCKKHFIQALYVFGSAASNNLKSTSDIDLLYTFDYGSFNPQKDSVHQLPFDPFLKQFYLKTELEELLKRKIDLIELKKFENPIFQRQVDSTKILIYNGQEYKEVVA